MVIVVVALTSTEEPAVIFVSAEDVISTDLAANMILPLEAFSSMSPSTCSVIVSLLESMVSVFLR
jgi:hypothetical protein